MALSVSVIIATFGSVDWIELGQKHAMPTAQRQTLAPTDVISISSTTLHEARNAGADVARGDWLCFLDADDQLEQGYLQACSDTWERVRDETGIDDMLLYPKVRYVHRDGSQEEARFPPRLRGGLREQNWMVIGTLIPKHVFVRAGGFQDYTAWEDWALWMRAVHLGAIPTPVDAAVYRAFVNPEGRNSTVVAPQRLRRTILREHDAWARGKP